MSNHTQTDKSAGSTSAQVTVPGEKALEVFQNGAGKALQAIQTGSSKAIEGTERAVRKSPLVALGIALATGILAGVLGYAAINSRPRSMRTRFSFWK